MKETRVGQLEESHLQRVSLSEKRKEAKKVRGDGKAGAVDMGD